MASVTRTATPGIDEITARKAPQLSGDLFTGEALTTGDFCYIKAADGLVYRTSGAAANEAAKFDGVCPRNCGAGEAVTLFGLGTRVKYSAGTLTPGQNLFADATTPGTLADAATTGGTVPLARAINAYDIRVIVNAA